MANREGRSAVRKSRERCHNRSQSMEKHCEMGSSPDLNHSESHKETLLTLVLCGNSASVQFGHDNFLLGDEQACFNTIETPRIVPVQRKILEHHVSVINMTGLHEADHVHHHIDQLMKENEIHAFIFVVRLGQLTDADKMGLEWLQRMFGDKVLQFVMILFTYEREEECDSIIDDLKKNPVLEQLLEKCGGRFHTCNMLMNSQSEMRDLMDKIEHLFNENQQQQYTREIQETEESQKSECDSAQAEDNIKDPPLAGPSLKPMEDREWDMRFREEGPQLRLRSEFRDLPSTLPGTGLIKSRNPEEMLRNLDREWNMRFREEGPQLGLRPESRDLSSSLAGMGLIESETSKWNRNAGELLRNQDRKWDMRFREEGPQLGLRSEFRDLPSTLDGMGLIESRNPEEMLRNLDRKWDMRFREEGPQLGLRSELRHLPSTLAGTGLIESEASRWNRNPGELLRNQVTCTNIVPRTRNDIQNYSHRIALNLNTGNKEFRPSKEFTFTDTDLSFPDHSFSFI